jgi:hypothetical protein
MDRTEWMEARNQEELDALIKQHGEALRVRLTGTWGDVQLVGRTLHSLDLSDLRACGTVFATEARIGGDLYAYGTYIGGSLILERARIEGALDGTRAHIGGSLHVGDAIIKYDIDAAGVHIGGDLNAHSARMYYLTLDGASICGAVNASCAHLYHALTYQDALIQGGIVLPDVMHGVPGRAVAQCDGYILWRAEDGRYYAGCRGPFTHKQALEHWGEHRQDERARVFREAILAGREAIARASSAQQAR